MHLNSELFDVNANNVNLLEIWKKSEYNLYGKFFDLFILIRFFCYLQSFQTFENLFDKNRGVRTIA